MPPTQLKGRSEPPAVAGGYCCFTRPLPGAVLTCSQSHPVANSYTIAIQGFNIAILAFSIALLSFSNAILDLSNALLRLSNAILSLSIVLLRLSKALLRSSIAILGFSIALLRSSIALLRSSIALLRLGIVIPEAKISPAGVSTAHLPGKPAPSGSEAADYTELQDKTGQYGLPLVALRLQTALVL